MSHIDARYQTNQVTIWRKDGQDMYGSPSYVLLGVFGATWESGRKTMRDSDGNEFVPRDVYYINSAATPKRGDLIKRGDNSAGVASGDVIRSITDYDNSFFGWANTLVVMTE